jgi:hypothetical protein
MRLRRKKCGHGRSSLNTGSYALLALWSWDKPVDKSLVSKESLVNKLKIFAKKKKPPVIRRAAF